MTYLYPVLELMFHIPNGGYRGKAEAARFKAEGVKPGVPDICLPVPRGKYHGLYVEMKRAKGGVISQKQIDWIKALRAQGYAVAKCSGFRAASATIIRYLHEGSKSDV